MNVAYSSSAQPDEGVNAVAVSAWLCVVSQTGPRKGGRRNLDYPSMRSTNSRRGVRN